MTKTIDDLTVPNGAENGEFSSDRVMHPDPGDPLGPPSQRWTTVVKGRESSQTHG